MTLFEIEESLAAIYDNLINDDGEINEQAQADFEALSLERDTKLENTALYIKQLTYEVKALQEEKKNLDSRIRQKRNTTEYLKGLLDHALDGTRFETPKAKVSFRKSTKVEVAPEFIKYAAGKGLVDYIDTKITQTPKKAEIKKALQAGEQLDYCHLITGRNVIIK